MPENLILLMVLSSLGVLHVFKMQKALTANNYLLTRATPESIAANNSKRANFSSSYAAAAADLLAPSVNESVLIQGENDAVNNATIDVDTSTARSTHSSNDGTKTNTNDDLLYSPISINAGSVATDNTGNEDERITCDFLNLNAQSSNETDSDITCVDPVGIDGQWVYKPDRTFFSGSTCCGWDEFPTWVMNENFCRQTMTNPHHYTGGEGEFYQQMGGNACTCAAKKFNDEYVWESPMLPKNSFDAIETCEKLGDRTVLMIGDSTMQQTASVLMNSFITRKCQAQIKFGLSDKFISSQHQLGERGRRWDEVLRMFPSDNVILAVGAHLQASDTFKETIDIVLDEIKSMDPNNMTFAFKTQQPGGCTKVVSPLNPADADRANNYASYASFNHQHFYQRDLYLLSRLQHDSIPVLDMRMLYSRGDAKVGSKNFGERGEHPDCLHICHPGPLDIVGRLFDQLLDNIGAGSENDGEKTLPEQIQ